MKKIRSLILVVFALALCLILSAMAAEETPADAELDQQIIALLGSDEDGGHIFTLDAWTLYCKGYYGIEWDGSYLNERNKYTLESGEELVRPFLEKYDITIRSAKEQQAEWEAFHRQYWGGRPMRMTRAAVPKSVVVPCERCGTNITVYEGDWTRSCYSCTCIETNCKRPGVFADDDYSGYDCRYHNHANSTKSAARYCQWPYITQHVTLPGLWSENGSPHANWEENYCPEHACKNALASGKGCTGKSADGIDYCLACDAFYGDSEAPASVTATPEGGWLRRNNTVAFSATDKSTPIEYRVLNSSGTVVRDWSTTASASLGNGTYSLYARDAKGNVSTAKSFTVANVDTSAPNKPALSKSPTATWSKTNVTVTITHGADNGVSGVARTEYSTNGGSTWATYSSALTISSTTTVYARTVDRAGNVSANASLQVNIDKTAPSAPRLAKSPNVSWTNANTTVTITAGTDTGGSGVARTEYSTNGWDKLGDLFQRNHG